MLNLFKRNSSGVIALEAMLSIAFLFGAFLMFWGVSVAIYNQTKLQTASQFAAQGSLTVFDRENYRGENVAGPFGSSGYSYNNAFTKAQRVGLSLFAENACGMIQDPASSSTPLTCSINPSAVATPANFRLSIQCAPQINGPWINNAPSNYVDPDCISGNVATAQAIRAQSYSRIDQPILFLAALSDNRELTTFPLVGSGQSYSYYPQD